MPVSGFGVLETPNVPAPVAAALQSSGGPGIVSLMELQTLGGRRYYWGDAEISAQSFLSSYDMGGLQTVKFEPLLLTPPPIKLIGSLVTQTTSATIGNLRGNTVSRFLSAQFTSDEFWGALAYARLYLPSCKMTLVDFLGTVGDPEIDEEHMTLPINGFSNWSAIKAPFIQIDTSCSLAFGSPQCGSTSGTRCQNTYGTCTSVERFTGYIQLWSQQVTTPPVTQIAQPVPVNIPNQRRPG